MYRYKTPLVRICVAETELPGHYLLFRSPHSLQTALCSDPTTTLRQRQPAVGLHLRNPSFMDYYSFNRPHRKDGWLSWPCWLTDSRYFTHKVVTRPAISLVQFRESLPARTSDLTTMLHHQLNTVCNTVLKCNIVSCLLKKFRINIFKTSCVNCHNGAHLVCTIIVLMAA